MLPLRDITNHSPERCLSLGVVDGGPRYLRLWRWSESAPFGSLMSLSQVIFQCRLTLMPCSMQECDPSMPCLLRAHGLPDYALKIVARATINRIQYAGPTWWGYANAADKGRIQRFLERMFKSGFLTEQDTDIESQVTKIIISAIYMVKLSLRSGLPTFHDYG